MSIVGTPNYFSLDLIYNQNIIKEKSTDKSTAVDWKKNDIFSLGLTFLEVLTLQSVKNSNTCANALC